MPSNVEPKDIADGITNLAKNTKFDVTKVEVEPKDIADGITNLAKNTKFDVIKVEVSAIIARRDCFNTKKVTQVSGILKQACENAEISHISHNINPRLHLNSHTLHLNDKGSACLAQNFREFLINTTG